MAHALTHSLPCSIVMRVADRYERRALTKPKLAYYLWRFVGNGERTFKQLTTPPTHPDTPQILADTIGFHRGGKPSAGTRLLVTFTYTSGTPFDDAPLGLTAPPAWISSPIQRYAIALAMREHAIVRTGTVQPAAEASRS
jgi:hypothetical protein